MQERQEKPGFVKIVFDYPFDLGLPNVYFPVIVREEDLVSLIKVERREGVIIYDKGKVLRDEEVDGKRKIHLKDISSQLDPTTEVVATGKNGHPVFHYEAGRSGKTSYPWNYCEVSVVFPINDVYSAWSRRDNHEFINGMTIKLFNRLLVYYRHVSNDVHNKLQAADDDLSFYTTIYISEFTSEEQKMPTLALLLPNLIEKREFKPFPMHGASTGVPLVKASISAPLMLNGLKQEMSPEQVQAFAYGSGGAYEVHIFNEILLAALERHAMDKDYRMTITEFDTAVEMTVMYYLIYFLIREGKNRQEVLDLFDDTIKASRDLPNGYLTTRQRMKRLNELFNKYREARNMSPVDIVNSEEFRNWNNDVRKKRNAGVHRWEHFSKADAEKAFHSAQTFIRYLQKIGDEIKQPA